MPEYHAIRIALGILSILLALRAHGFLRAYMAVHALWCLFPALVWSEAWKAYLAVPCVLLMAILSLAATIEMVQESIDATRHEQRLIFLWATLIGGSLCVMAFWWHPERWFQSIMIGRQYATLMVATIAGCLCAYVSWMRPVDSPRVCQRWVIWLFLTFLLSTTTKGGLLWCLVPWKGEMIYWRGVSDLCLVGQVFTGLSLLAWLSSKMHDPLWSRNRYRPEPFGDAD